MPLSEDQLSRWAKAPSETEEGKCQSAVRQVTDAIRQRFGNDVSIDTQGSYKNRTNVRKDSDVDILVLHNTYYFPDVGGLSESDKRQYWASFRQSDYTFANFKNDVHGILTDTFGRDAVTRKNKCIRVAGTTSRVNADVVPCFVHTRYRSFGSVEVEGIEFVSHNGPHVTGFPQQHYDNGVKKNEETKRMFKSIVRILKNIRNDFVDSNTMKLEAMRSFFLECLVWNVPSYPGFSQPTYRDATKAIITTVWNDMRDSAKANDYTEASELQWLFRGSTRTPKQAEDFMLAAWNVVG